MKKIIFTRGTGWSGSSTLIDLFHEFDNCSLIGKEFNICRGFSRTSNGVFHIARLFKNNINVSSFEIEKLKELLEYLYSVQKYNECFGDKFIDISMEYINNLLDYEPVLIPDGIGTYTDFKCSACNNYNLYVKDLKLLKPIKTRDKIACKIMEFAKNILNERSGLKIINNPQNLNYYLYCNNLTYDKFLKESKNYINKVLNMIEFNENIVLDQGIDIAPSNDIDFQLQFFENPEKIRIFIVTRDMRDVYMSGRKYSCRAYYIPEDFEMFKYRFKFATKNAFLKHSQIMHLRFEDIVLNYDKILPGILDFAEISPKNHVRPKSVFNPEISKENIGRWKSHHDQEIMKKIEKEFPEFCWND